MTVSLMGFRLGGDDGKDAMVLTDGVCCQLFFCVAKCCEVLCCGERFILPASFFKRRYFEEAGWGGATQNILGDPPLFLPMYGTKLLLPTVVHTIIRSTELPERHFNV